MTAIQKGMQTLALTEHMPREERDFYPEEVTFFLLVSLPFVWRWGSSDPFLLDQKEIGSARIFADVQ